jgi:hypothetical protein
MTFLPVLIVAALAGHPAPAQPQPAAEVQVGLYVYQADGGIPTRAYSTTLNSVVWATESLCHTGVGRLPAGPYAHAWTFSGTIISKTENEAVIQLEWQRTLDQGQPVSGRGRSVQLRLQRGQPVPLDFAAPSSTQCSVASVGFEARYEPRAAASLRPPSGGAPAGGAARTANTSAPERPEAGSVRERADLLDVTLWLVHTSPGADEEVRQQSLRSTIDGATFAFPPVTIDVPGGQATVQVNGSYSIGNDRRQITFTLNRQLAFRPMSPGPHRTTVQLSKGEGKTVIDMPGPDDVVEFALPSTGVGVGPGGPDKFSVRVRVRRAPAS